MKIRKIILISLLALLVLAGCKKETPQSPIPEPTKSEPTAAAVVKEPTEEPVAEPTQAVMEQTYPIVESTIAAETYPIAQSPTEEITYPLPEPTVDPNNGPIFTIDEPVSASELTVTGTGPAGVPIKLIDVTTMGETLALTTIKEDGTYQFDLEKELLTGHAIGLQIGDLTNTNFNYDDFVYSTEYFDKPMIGIIFYIAIVTGG